MAAPNDDALPGFFKVFRSGLSSDSMLIPLSYYDVLPPRLPRIAILNGTGGCSWDVAMTRKRDEVHFGTGWSAFVKDNSLTDGDFLTFDYDGRRTFEVSIFGPDTCKEDRAVEEDKEDSVYSISSEDDTDTSSKSAITVPRIKNNKGKKKVNVVADDSESSDHLGALRGRQKKVQPRIKNPEAYLDDPNNAYFETKLKNRTFELNVPGQLQKDYCLKYQDYVDYIDGHKSGKLRAEKARWSDKRLSFKKWNCICKRNNLTEGDAILCELFREGGLVHAIKIHIVREADL